MDTRQRFQQFLAQTSPDPVALDIRFAEGSYIYDQDGKAYLDMIGGISVAQTGHRHPKVLEAIREQSERYLHLMVYGELIQSPQVDYAEALVSTLPKGLDSVYFTNSGAEAVDGAVKLARRLTGRPEIIACQNSYHGSTLGALSLIGDEYWRRAFRPLLPGVHHYPYNDESWLDQITDQTAAVLLETIQAEAGVREPDPQWLEGVVSRCRSLGVLVVFDEIQVGLGRTGKRWAFEHYGQVPDILLAGKALGGGLPLAAFISSRENMASLTHSPVLGHMTTFGGHPLSCAAGLAAFRVLDEEGLIEQVEEKSRAFADALGQPAALDTPRRKGLFMALPMKDREAVIPLLHRCLGKGLFADWFLFAPDCIRIVPPLTISLEEIRRGAEILRTSIEELSGA